MLHCRYAIKYAKMQRRLEKRTADSSQLNVEVS
jgi:hypothetical protein